MLHLHIICMRFFLYMAVFVFYKMHCEINTLHAEIHYNRVYTSISITINTGYVHLTLFCMYIKNKFKRFLLFVILIRNCLIT